MLRTKKKEELTKKLDALRKFDQGENNAEEVEMSEETIEQLKALGYIE